MRTIKLPDGTTVPALGLGTWRMGEQRARRTEEVAALRLGVDLGLGLVDTAEMYGEGGAEEVVGEAIEGRRESVFLVSKVYPHNASRRGVPEACERSLRRLGTDRIDLYLLHWRGSVPLSETIEAFERLVSAGKIRRWGVSNLDVEDMEELLAVAGGKGCATNQVLYHLGERGIEHSLLPFMRRSGIPAMAYSPLGQGPLLRDATLASIAKLHGVDPAAVALAFLLRRDDVLAIPKAARLEHVRAIAAARELVLSKEDLARLEAAHPAPRRRTPLAIL